MLKDIELKLTPAQFKEYLVKYQGRGLDIYFKPEVLANNEIVWHSFGEDVPDHLTVWLTEYRASIEIEGQPEMPLVQFAEYLRKYASNDWDIYFTPTLSESEILWTSCGDAPEEIKVVLNAFSSSIKMPLHRKQPV